MSRSKFLLFISFILFCNFSDAQETFQRENYTFETHAYNIGINAVLGGVGSIINKDKNEKWTKAFVRGFGVGAVGGYIKLKGKELNQFVYQRNTPEFAWLSKAVYFAGNSIVENAATNRPIFSNWHFMLGFVRFDLNLQNQTKFRARIMPAAFLGTIYTAAIAKSFDANLSLRTGTPIFFTEDKNAAGTSYPGTILLSESFALDLYATIAHEEGHQRQGYDSIGLNTMVNNLLRKMNWYEASEKYIYWDYNQIGHNLLYTLLRTDGVDGRCYYNNFFEAEAEWFATRTLVQCK